MAATQGLTGRGGNITVATVVIPITKWTLKNTSELSDATDSGNYDPASGQTFNSQYKGTVGAEVTLEGNYDLGTTSANISARLKQDGPFPIVLKLNAATTYASANFDLSDVEVSLEVPGATNVTWSATAKSNGIITYY